MTNKKKKIYANIKKSNDLCKLVLYFDINTSLINQKHLISVNVNNKNNSRNNISLKLRHGHVYGPCGELIVKIYLASGTFTTISCIADQPKQIGKGFFGL